MPAVEYGVSTLPLQLQPLAAEMACVSLDSELPCILYGPTPVTPRYFSQLKVFQWSDELQVYYSLVGSRPRVEMLRPTSELEDEDLHDTLRRFMGSSEAAEAALTLLQQKHDIARLDPMLVYGPNKIDDCMRQRLTRRLQGHHMGMTREQLGEWRTFFRARYRAVQSLLMYEARESALDRLDECTEAFERAWNVSLGVQV